MILQAITEDQAADGINIILLLIIVGAIFGIAALIGGGKK